MVLPIGDILEQKHYNVNVVKDSSNYVYDEDVAKKIRDAIDKPKATGEIIAERLDAPKNVKFYIKLVYQYPITTLFECLHLTHEAHKEGYIKTTKAQYFWGIVRRKKTYG
mgnify:CR=1 FL=1